MEDSQKTYEVHLIRLSKIIDNPNQPRTLYDEQAIRELANSIQEQGLLQPIMVRSIAGDQYELVVGSRRLRSFKLLRRDEIPAIIVEEGNPALLSLLENIQREDLSLRDEAAAFKRVIDSGEMSQVELTKNIGRHKTFVNRMVRLAERIEECGELVSWTVLGRWVYMEMISAPVEALIRAEAEDWSEEKARKEMQKLSTAKKRHASEIRRKEVHISESIESQSLSSLPIVEDPDFWEPVGVSDQGFIVYPFRFRKGFKINMGVLIEKVSGLQKRLEQILEDLKANQRKELLKREDDKVVLPLKDGLG